MKRSLSFQQDGTFKIVQFTDIHWKDGRAEDRRSRKLMESVLDAEQPDLVVFTGDIIYSAPVAPEDVECENPQQAFRDAVAVVEERGFPWAFVFGNHDTEQRISREELMQVALTHKHIIAESGPEHIEGSGNYTIELVDTEGNPAFNLYFLDSGSYSPLEHVPGYNWIHRDQIGWLTSECLRLNPDDTEEKLQRSPSFISRFLNIRKCGTPKSVRVINSNLCAVLPSIRDYSRLCLKWAM